MARLAGSVPIHNEDGTTSWYGPADDEILDEVLAKIGAHCFEDGEHPKPELLGGKPRRGAKAQATPEPPK